MPETALEALVETKALIADPAHWTKDVHARDREGNEVYFNETNAVRWCVDGALAKVCGMSEDWRTTRLYYKANQRLAASVNELWATQFTSIGITDINDMHGHPAVMKMLDHAIAEEGGAP